MANIKLSLDHPLVDGEIVTFKAPCNSTAVTGLKVYYTTLTEDSTLTENKTFTFRDAHLNDISNLDSLFLNGAYMQVILDTTNNYAYIQNADTNGYIEDKITTHENDTNHIPSGSILSWAAFDVPSGYLLCDGSAISRETYSLLYSVIGITFGAGDGTTTFNLPDLTGKVLMGSNNVYQLGTSGGEAVHALTSSELPTITGSIDAYAGDAGLIRYASGCFTPQTQKAAPVNVDAYAQVVSYNTAKLSIGGGQAHNNMPPYTAVNYIIKY